MSNENLLNKVKELRLTDKNGPFYRDRLENIIEALVRRACDATNEQPLPLGVLNGCQWRSVDELHKIAVDLVTERDGLRDMLGQTRSDNESPKLRPQEQRTTAAECSLKVIKFSRDRSFPTLVHLTLDNSSDAKAAYSVVSTAIEFGLPLRLVAGEPTAEHNEAHQLVMKLGELGTSGVDEYYWREFFTYYDRQKATP